MLKTTERSKRSLPTTMPKSAVKCELVLRLASLLWRPRCATTIETGRYDLQADHLNELGDCNPVRPASRQSIYALFERRTLSSADEVFTSAEPFAKRTVDFARCFLRLSNLPNCAFDRLSRYETALWCQVGQTLFALDALDRRKPQERGAPFGHRQPARISGLYIPRPTGHGRGLGRSAMNSRANDIESFVWVNLVVAGDPRSNFRMTVSPSGHGLRRT